MKTVVWFGNAGTPYGDFGLPNLRIVFPAIERVARDIPLRLVCVSNDRMKFDEVTRGVSVPCKYIQWSRDECLRQIAAADVCVVPNSRDRFSIVKSANRLALALSLGTPVVATSTPATVPLAPFIVLDDWEGGLRLYLSDNERARQDADAGRAYVLKNFEASKLAHRWIKIISEVSQTRRKAAAPAIRADGGTVFVSQAKSVPAAVAELESIAAIDKAEEVRTLVLTPRMARAYPGLLALAGKKGVSVNISKRHTRAS